VWWYGDPTTRKRLFIVGISKELGPIAHKFNFPTQTHTPAQLVAFRDIAVADKDVPTEYWRQDEPTRVPWREPVPNNTHKIAQAGPGMGHSSNPNAVLSWDALGNSQTTYNGGARRPRLDWQATKNGPVGRTRLTVPIETVRAASLPDEYLQWCFTFKQDPTFLRECVNNGTPSRTSYAIDRQVWALLQQAQQKSAQAAGLQKHTCEPTSTVRSTQLDTGCNLQLHQRSVEGAIMQPTRSQYTIKVANSEVMTGAMDGELTMRVINTEQHPGIPDKTTITRPVTTVEDLPRELFAIDDYYRDGYSILLRHPSYEDGVAEIYKQATEDTPEVRIPVRYDWDQSGFWLDYEVGAPTNYQSGHHHTTLRECYTAEQTEAIGQAAHQHDDVVEVRYGADTQDYNILGVKMGLKHRRAQLTKQEFHREYGHLGSLPDCNICKRTQGSMRRLTKVVDKFREQRRGHTWVMDTVTWSHRDNDGSKFMVVLRDKGSAAFKLFCIYRKSDIRQELREWITKLRTDLAFKQLDYLPVSLIETDRAGEWGLDCKEWSDLETEQSFQTIYVQT
jgi:hypothetical protein